MIAEPRLEEACALLVEGHLSAEVVDFEVRTLCSMGAQLRLGAELGRDVTLDTLLCEFNAVVIATGETSPADCASMGVENSSAFVKTHPDTWLTSHPGVFATGRAVRNLKPDR